MALITVLLQSKQWRLLLPLLGLIPLVEQKWTLAQVHTWYCTGVTSQRHQSICGGAPTLLYSVYCDSLFRNLFCNIRHNVIGLSYYYRGESNMRICHIVHVLLNFNLLFLLPTRAAGKKKGKILSFSSGVLTDFTVSAGESWEIAAR